MTAAHTSSAKWHHGVAQCLSAKSAGGAQLLSFFYNQAVSTLDPTVTRITMDTAITDIALQEGFFMRAGT